MSPDRARHDDFTVQVPTTLPPHDVPLGQLGAVVVPPLPPLAEEPPLPGLPPLPVVPPEAPPLPVVPPELPPVPVVPPVPGSELVLVQPVTAKTKARAAALANPNRPFRMRPHEACDADFDRYRTTY